MMPVTNAPGKTIGTMLAGIVNTVSASNFRHRCSSAATTPILVEAIDER